MLIVKKLLPPVSFVHIVNGMKPESRRSLGLRISKEVSERLARFEAETNHSAVSLAREALMAALDHYEEVGKISLPIRISTGQCCKPKVRGRGSPPK
jgi:hypothetical protein